MDAALSLPFELEALSRAKRYQQWVADAVQPLMGKRILELGSGLGNMSQWLPVRERLVLTETDHRFIQALEKKSLPRKIPPKSPCAHLI